MSTFFAVWSFIGRYKYVITVSFLLIFVCFAGEDSLLANYQRQKEIEQMREDLEEYTRHFWEDSLALWRLESDPGEAERIARAKYFMKRSGEVVYLFEEETSSADSVK